MNNGSGSGSGSGFGFGSGSGFGSGCQLADSAARCAVRKSRTD